ncbi:unnamed protein product [Eruca vesicaria subsp. sativa]|uniref:Uncharacterized protein n=1 Tax=Eruca vesicaria subsp. sativa TaxID=29727 RepID=A0ABC8KV73_ERUVS|nr:unnamed protein product [Eruca vesicaria subsp. sativa]
MPMEASSVFFVVVEKCRESVWCGILWDSIFFFIDKDLIKGGTVVNAHHQQLADVYVEDGIIVSVQPNIKVGDEVTVLDAAGKQQH